MATQGRLSLVLVMRAEFGAQQAEIRLCRHLAQVEAGKVARLGHRALMAVDSAARHVQLALFLRPRWALLAPLHIAMLVVPMELRLEES